MLSPLPLRLSAAPLRIAFALTLVGCVFDPSGADGTGGDGGLPDADLGGADAGDGAPPDGMPCIGAESMCLGTQALASCVSGQMVHEDCTFGCLDTPAAHCAAPVLSNDLDLAWLEGAVGDVVVGAGETWVFETSTGIVSMCSAAGPATGNVHTAAPGIQQGINFQVRPASTPGDLDLGAWAFDSLRIEAGGTLRVIGDLPGALLVRDDVRIEGVLDVSAGAAACNVVAACGPPGPTDLRSCGGPGGGDGGAHDQDGFGPGHGQGGTSGGVGINEIGGGGGAFGAVGGASGGPPIGPPNDIGGDAVPGGVVYGMPDLEPLIGGSGGGGGGESTPGAGIGGGGGGALQIVALDRIEVLQPSGILRAGGAGGGAGLSVNGNGGGGGGSGGALLLEAARVTVESTMAANGGGGGGSGSDTAISGTDGLASATPAAGGTGLHAGGAGGASGAPAGAAANPMGTAADGTAGGGGGVGRIYVRAPPGNIDLSGAIVSPTPGEGMIRVQ